MLEKKSKVTEDVVEEKQSDKGSHRENAKLQRMIWRKSKDTEEGGEEKQSYRG